ncbi:family 20 glycosylhydrolase [Chitinophagaceae bacterium LB-8]|uniref:beta-N-acetylhexosaminidase n=1 Tax=Paraflavisolibacter caeni TaxID=2982496 RepID=A0A9X3BIU9_9BACT|nr:family 20 glycosylhydrolase [Paraflavisolibacter caeni]MCU7550463.1 family 20 glycosylhydrolase [Paraflavisolibacter caeni]
MKKKLLQFITYLLFINGSISAQLQKPVLHDSLFSTYYHQRVTLFKSIPQTKGDIIFWGNSITDGNEWAELFADLRIKNRGISGDVTAGLIHRIDEIINRRPAKVFLLIGTNDLARGIASDSVVKNILWIADYLKQEIPATKLYVQSIFPVNSSFGKFAGHMSKAEEVKKVNDQLSRNAMAHHYFFIDLYSSLVDADGWLDARYTNDGLHLTGEGYMLWKHLIYPYVYDRPKQASLIPLPQNIEWKKEKFPLYASNAIVINDKAILKEARLLQHEMQRIGKTLQIIDRAVATDPQIELKLGKVDAPQSSEAYHLIVNASKITLTANTAHGIFNGLQTLFQCMRSGVMVDGCEIKDWPQFSWRGYMVDVGRNYQSMDLLKQQIEIMSHYKLNIFHFHLTEDVAWRLAFRQYPKLTAPQNMLRDKGLYYSENELNELIAFCKERYITLIPEIDMPGHSAAFTRAFGFDMQSDSGLAIVKNILKEFCATYDVPYLHIGGDEVKITNKNFLPEITALIHRHNKKTIGWDPGGNLDKKTIRQLWMKDGAVDKACTYIDSRHLYLNHMDPLESVVTIFHRQLGDRMKEDKNISGGTLCIWHDRRVAKEDDFLKMNPVYPGMLAFSERSWRGGGYQGWITNFIQSKADTAFTQFEQRLMEHRDQYFCGLPFPYVKQSFTVWNLYGPYENSGNLSKCFEPENKSFNESKSVSSLYVTGGTIVLRHWWHPLVQGVIMNPKENTTWYATTRLWSDEDGFKDFWIGFNNLSRSPATDTPPVGKWDEKESAVWVNGKPVSPPVWKRGGQKGDSEIPLQDEGYEYRAPTKIYLEKGWNSVLIKAPVGTFKGADWQNPVKWMFTFIPADGVSTME